MTTPQLSEESLFDAARRITEPGRREEYLREACRGDEALRGRVEKLLRAAEQDPEFLEVPASGLSAATDLAADAQARTVGPFKLLQLIGEGGMGRVYMAEQEHPVRRRVALKVIKAGMDTKQVVARFEAERQALALMDHPNIAKVLDAGTTDAGRPFFVMELVKGTPITRYAEEHRLTVRDRLVLFADVCRAVQHAHQKGVIHRDLKPSNILVAPYDGTPVPKVIDFGVAKATGSPLTDKTLFTEFGAVVGTLEYMSPEQAELNNLDIDTRSDVYSLGVLLYELLTGATPLTRARLSGTPLLEVLRLIREEEPPWPSERRRKDEERRRKDESRATTGSRGRLLAALRSAFTIRPSSLQELDWIAMRALEKDRNRRYETAAALAADIGRYLADEPVLACPPTVGYRLRKFARRNRWALLGAGLVSAALAGGAVAATWGMVRAWRAEEGAGKDRDRAVEAEADAEGFNRFFVEHVLAASRPDRAGKGLGKDVTLAEALEAAERDLPAAFAGRPRAEAKARQALGITWSELGQYARAEAHLRRALELSDEHHGPDSRPALTARAALMQVFLQARRYEDARHWGEEAVARLTAAFGPDDRDTLWSMRLLAEVNRNLKRLDEAEKLLGAALPRLQATLGPDHRDTLSAIDGLAKLRHDQKQVEESVRLLEHVLARRRAVLGPDHPQTLATTGSLAVAHRSAGRTRDVVPLLERVLESRTKILGLDHPETSAAMSNLALAYHDVDRLADAEPLYRQVLAWREDRLGLNDPRTVAALNNLAAALHDAGRVAEAVPVYQAMVDRRTAALGPNAAETLVALNSLGVGYRDAGEPTKAVAVFEEALRRRKAVLGSTNRNTLITMENLAGVYHQTGEYARAESLFRELLRRWPGGPVTDDSLTARARLAMALLAQRKWSDAEAVVRDQLPAIEAARDDWRTAELRSLLGAALTGLGQLADAEPLLTRGYAGLAARKAPIPASYRSETLSAAAARLANLYEARGEPGLARRWAEEARRHREPAAPGDQ
jgi:serine/threonine protein kinase